MTESMRLAMGESLPGEGQAFFDELPSNGLAGQGLDE
jgi:hypothetical protein